MYSKVLLCFALLLSLTVSSQNSNQLYPYLGKKRFGYVDNQFKQAISEDFSFAGPFIHGLAIASDQPSSGLFSAQLGLINTSGNWVLKCNYDKIYPFFEGYAVVKKGNNYGMVDTTGGIVMPLRFEELDQYGSGLIGYRDGFIWGFTDAFGNIKIPAQFDNITPFDGNRCFVKLYSKWIIIDKTGKQINAGEWDLTDGFSEGLAGVKFLGGEFGFIDSTGRISIPSRFENVRPFKNGRAAVRLDGLWGFIDKTGAQISKPVYYEVQDFSEGMAAVEYKGKWGYIDSSGRVIVSAVYTEAEPYYNGLARVKDSRGTWFYLDKSGKVVYSYR